MGQFASSAFNGDPYIDLMRALPDKELIWWIQKGIWLAQGFTFCEHIARTYPQMFVHQCQHCNGAGIVTCPHCDGQKKVQAHAQGHRIAGKSPVGQLMLEMDVKDCEHCGDFGPWDAESEWHDKWVEWETKNAYFDRTYGPLWDEMAVDIKHEGKIDMQRSVTEDEEPPERVNGWMPEVDRMMAKEDKYMKAMLYRYGGHPYDHDDMISNKIIDITKPMDENLENIALYRADIPIEMHPEAFPENLIMANSPIAAFNYQIRMEYCIMKNLDAAIQNQPKPITFEPSAGTVPCPVCEAKPFSYSFMPNLGRLFRTETPFWMRTLNNMQQMGTWQYALPASHGTPLQEAASTQGAATSSSRYGEVPRQRCKDEEIDEAIKESAAPGLWKFTPGQGSGSLLSKYGADIWGPDNSYMEHWGMRPGPIGGPLVDPTDDPQDYGPNDPLSVEPSTSRPLQKSPIINDSAEKAKWMFSNMNPAKNLARKVRDLRTLDQAENTEEEEEIINWLKTRDSLAAEFKGDVPLPRA